MKFLKRKVFGIPLVVLLLFAIPTIALAAYLVITVIGSVTVEESITVAPTSFAVTLKPKEVHSEPLTISNSGTADVDVELAMTVLPGVGVVVTLSKDKVTVPASGSTIVTVTSRAKNDVIPGPYTISTSISRSSE